MTAAEIYKWLAKRDIRLKVRDDSLVIDAPEGAMTPEIQERLKARKKDLIEYLRPTKPRAPDDDGFVCPAGDMPCRALATYQDREGVFCAHTAVFEQRPKRPWRITNGAKCPRLDHSGN